VDLGREKHKLALQKVFRQSLQVAWLRPLDLKTPNKLTNTATDKHIADISSTPN
jgi:hypothetical protein